MPFILPWHCEIPFFSISLFLLFWTRCFRSFFLGFFFFFLLLSLPQYHLSHLFSPPKHAIEWMNKEFWYFVFRILCAMHCFQHRPTQITFSNFIMGKSAYSKLVCKLYLRMYPVMWTNWCALLHISIDYFEMNEQNALSKHRQSTSAHTHTQSTTCTLMYRNQLFSQMGIMK